MIEKNENNNRQEWVRCAPPYKRNVVQSYKKEKQEKSIPNVCLKSNCLMQKQIQVSDGSHIYSKRKKKQLKKKIHQYFQLNLAKANNFLTFADVLG